MSAELESGYDLDTAAIRRAFDKASASYDAAAVLQAQVRSRMLSRLDLVELKPRTVVDAGCGTGQGARALLRRYPACQVIALDLSEGMLAKARRQRHWLRTPLPLCADSARMPLPDHSVDMVFSSLMMQWCNDLDGLFAEYRRILKPGGLLTFSTFGPDTLRELRQAWSAVDGFVHVSRFIDMHDIGDAKVRAGLAEPVLDVEHFRMTYSALTDLMRDLKAIGASNAASGRRRGLTGRGRLRAVETAYEGFRHEGRLPATYEVVYGHGWGVAGAGRVKGPTETVVAVGDIQRLDRARG